MHAGSTKGPEPHIQMRIWFREGSGIDRRVNGNRVAMGPS
jgi:hypothetical protein